MASDFIEDLNSKCLQDWDKLMTNGLYELITYSELKITHSELKITHSELKISHSDLKNNP